MTRLDVYIAEQSPEISRSRACAYIKAGKVTVNGRVATKPAMEIASEDEVSVSLDRLVWVGRGAEKLVAALQKWNIDVAGRVCLDIGASTGGFTQVLLTEGASHVTALDVGHDQLHPSLRADSRVTNVEGVNIRHVDKNSLEQAPEIIVIDVSFISLRQVLPIAYELLACGGELVALVKPQFEVGKGNTKKGIVCKRELREQVRFHLIESAELIGFSDVETIESPIVGGDGNTEYLMHAVKK